jgi:hypothetical protein
MIGPCCVRGVRDNGTLRALETRSHHGRRVEVSRRARREAALEHHQDAVITKVWKEPSYFVAHPRAIAAFGRECTRRGVPPATITLFGAPFLTWRGLPIIPSDKVRVQNEKTSILLVRTGERKRGVVGLFQPGLPGEVSPSLSVRVMGINAQGATQYLLSLYCSTAVLVHDALAVLEDVAVDRYHEYA